MNVGTMERILLMDNDAMARVLERVASQIHEKHASCEALMLVGIRRRGADLAHRLSALLEEKYGRPLALGTLDINLYRDDWTSLECKPLIGQSHIPEKVSGRIIILVDDVLFSGRTVRAALDALLDYGRPKAVELLVLIDRGHRELPIQADYVGKQIQTRQHEHVNVLLMEQDGQDAVVLQN